ncbi:MAG: hypothetical protein JO293_03855 [Candidatus Eremiobacteraeota bacterium]|nr:hypothetical protein [Candidatus Eremiobacteraeota bacterium]MBV8222468.1 hypothetical protein [Candidatus Eremiobacteraeota bacterium]
MRQQILAVPNSQERALEAIDELVAGSALDRPSGEALKLLYLEGWSDGFASVRRADADLIFGMSGTELAHALGELASTGLIQMRDAGECVAIEILSLGTCPPAAGLPLSWWRFYQVELDADPD